MNEARISGRLGKDPEIRFTQSGMAVARFSVAVSRGKNKDGTDKGTDWINCTAFDGLAEAVGDNTSKGAYVIVDGRIRIENYQDKDGNKRQSFGISVNNIAFPLWPAKKDGQGFKDMGQPVNDEDIPF